MAKVAFRDVLKRFGDTLVIKDLNVEVQDGEFLVFVGPSGSGKSTILRMVAGLDKVTDGEILIGDQVINNRAPKDRDIAMVFQSYALYPNMTVYDNMAYGLRKRRVDKEKIDERIKSTAQSLGIPNLLDRKPGQLSGGQRQRVALGRAIVRDPQAFLLDEPLSNLDAKLRVEARAFLSDLHDRLGATFIYVTHDQVEAMTMGNRIAVIAYNYLQQVDTPENLYLYPDNVFVAGFIGSPAMNFIRVNMVQHEALTLETAGFSVPVPEPKRDLLDAYKDQEIIMGIRPENIHDPRFKPAEVETQQVDVEVRLVEMLGAEKVIYFKLDEHDDTRHAARVDVRSEMVEGETATLALDLENIHFFDAETEIAIRTDPPPSEHVRRIAEEMLQHREQLEQKREENEQMG